MDKLIQNINISGEIQVVIFVILAILVLSSIALGFGDYLVNLKWSKSLKPEQNRGG